MEEFGVNSMCKDGKTMKAIYSRTIRGIVSAANELNIAREDIVTLTSENAGEHRYVLVYYS